MKRRITPRLEELGNRTLPSVTPFGFHPPAHVSHPAQAAHQERHHGLDGQGAGTYERDAVQSGAGVQYRLSGTAHLDRLGDFAVAGTAHSVGFIQNGHATGTLTFTGPKGTFTLELTGPSQPGFSPLPGRFDYRVTGGTGDYAGLSGHGSLSLDLKAATSGTGGTFTLRL